MESLPKLPPAAAPIWAAFWEIRETGTNNGYGPNRLTRAEIHAWERDEGKRLTRFERRLVIEIDRHWLEHANSEANKAAARARERPRK